MILIILVSICEVFSLEITSLTLPSQSPEGRNLLFSCGYTVNRAKLVELDIKWYLGTSPSSFILFLPHIQKEPQVVDPRFRENIVFREGLMSSGFMMENVTADMSGVYTCKVSTNTEERMRRKRVTIYSKYIC